MTPQAASQGKRATDSRPLDFSHWLASRGMNPNRPRPAGRQAALLMEYRSYLVRAVGKEEAGQWFEKYAPKKEPPAAKAAETA